MRTRAPRRRRGFTLVEVTLALGIAVFCLVVVFGLLTVGVNTGSYSIEQTVATTFLSAIAGDLRGAQNVNPADPPKGSKALSSIYKLNVPASVAAAAAPTLQTPPSYLGYDGQLLTNPATARYQLNVWMTPGAGRNATLARVMLSWPAGASLAVVNGGTTDYNAGAVEAVIALDRN